MEELQPVLLKKYNSDKWIDISKYIDSSNLPGGSDPENNSLYQFNLGFIDPRDNLGNPIKIENGDDIAVLQSDSMAILDDMKLGCVTTCQKVPKALDCSSGMNRFVITYSCTVTQRDWSFYPFKLNANAFDDNSIFQQLTTVLDYIFSSAFVIDKLGGVMSNDVIIPKYVLQAEDVEIQINEIEAISRELLTEILNPLGYAWGVQCFSELNNDTLIKEFYQVVIWQQD